MSTLVGMQRIIGTEVEYGISSPSDPTANPILTSTQAVLAYAAAAGLQRAKRTRWDYEVESPLRDARGFDLSRSSGPPPVVDADEVGAANMILTNGARLYVDHAHPEYSAPECTDPMDAVIWEAFKPETEPKRTIRTEEIAQRTERQMRSGASALLRTGRCSKKAQVAAWILAGSMVSGSQLLVTSWSSQVK